MKINIDNVAKVYGERLVFKNISFDVLPGEICVLTGPNGSGKSTLLKIMAGVLAPTVGTVSVIDNGVDAAPGTVLNKGFCAPYLTLYPNLSLKENLDFFNGIRGTRWEMKWVDKSGLKERLDDPLKSYSSGMAQRAKLLFAVAHEPPLLFLDEPGSNLDDAGHAFVEEIIWFQKTAERILVIATNEEKERSYGDKIIGLDSANN